PLHRLVYSSGRNVPVHRMRFRENDHSQGNKDDVTVLCRDDHSADGNNISAQALALAAGQDQPAKDSGS
ncbi:hypothetical protein LCGC14_2908340, partial [marine sediment metagenome]